MPYHTNCMVSQYLDCFLKSSADAGFDAGKTRTGPPGCGAPEQSRRETRERQANSSLIKVFYGQKTIPLQGLGLWPFNFHQLDL